MKRVTVFWFRRDLRLADNAGLWHALSANRDVLPVFIFDSGILSKLEDKADRRVDFIHQALRSLDRDLKKKGSSLWVEYGSPEEVFERLTGSFDIAEVYCNRDYEPDAELRDRKIASVLQHKGIEFHSYKDQVIFERDDVLKKDGMPYTVFTPYSRQWKACLIPGSCMPFASESKDNYVQFSATVPELQDIGFTKTDVVFREPVVDREMLTHYAINRDFPALNATSGLSVHLRFGTVSIRHLVTIALQTSEAWLNELIWREFFMQILWHFPQVVTQSFRPEYDKIEWRNDESDFKRWCEGTTGYPIVDAGMRELNATGQMHNRVRMITASFLTKHLLIDWRWGEAWFAQKLLDYDLSANNGNWQWSAGCGCDAAPYFRVFNPSEQTRKFDPQLQYIRKWVPEVEEFGYPEPMVDHKLARERALNTYKAALKT